MDAKRKEKSRHLSGTHGLRGRRQRLDAYAALPSAVRDGLCTHNVESYLQWLAEYLQDTCKVDYVLVGELHGQDWDRIRSLVLRMPDGVGDNIEYDLKGTPCGDVVGKTACCFPHSVSRLYPDDLLLQEMGIEGYVGVPLFDSRKRPLGILLVLSEEAIADDDAARIESLLLGFASRTSTVLESRRTVHDYRELSIAASQPVTEEAFEELLPILTRALHVKSAFVAVPADEPGQLETIAVSHGGRLLATLRFDTTQNPGARVWTIETEFVQRGLAELYPDSTLVPLLGAESYLGMPLVARDGRVLGLLAVLHDRSLPELLIDDPLLGVFRSRLRSELERAEFLRERQEIEKTLHDAQKDRSLAVLAGGIAHDFNNLLLAVSGFAELCEDEVGDNGEAMHCLEQISAASTQAAELCRQLLDYAGKRPMQREALDLGAVVSSVTELLELSVAKRALLSFELSGDPLPVLVDGSQIRQILMNLLTNAADSTRIEDGKIIVRTGCEAFGEQPQKLFAWFEVEDNGSGMAEEVRRRLFEPFFSTKSTGRGLGMSSVRGIVRRHGGDIEVESSPGTGTRIRVRIPVHVGEESRSLAAPHAATGGRAVEGRLLLADDEGQIREFAHRVLTAAGYEVELCEDGDEALERFYAEPERFDLAVLDYSMPGLDGRQAALQMRASRARLPVLLVSGFLSEDIAELGAEPEPGPFAVLPKPYRRQELLDAVAGLLEVAAPTRG